MYDDQDSENVRASIFDRLVNSENGGKFTGRQTLEQLIESIHRDLEQLLNTRWRIRAWPPNLGELERSMINYGIPDFAGISMSSPIAREEFREMVEDALRIHEKRFLRVRVELQESSDPIDRTLRFTIDALVRASPEPAEVRFDSQVDPTSNRINIDEKSL